MLPTPAALRDRRLPTAGPAATAARTAGSPSTVAPVSPAVRARMGETWTPGCPVALADLRYVTVSSAASTAGRTPASWSSAGEVADDVVAVFRRPVRRARFPIEEMRLATTADLEAPPTGDGNNTAAFVCRAARRQTRWSAHAYGLAVDVNPFQNPLPKRDLVLPELASAYLDRGDAPPGHARPATSSLTAFAAIGWTWGGTWRTART